MRKQLAQKIEEPKNQLPYAFLCTADGWGSGRKTKATVLIHKELKDSMEKNKHASSFFVSLCKFFRKPYNLRVVQKHKDPLVDEENQLEDGNKDDDKEEGPTLLVALCIIIFYPLILPTWIIWKMYDQVTNCFNYDPRNKDQLDDVDKDFPEEA